MSYGLLYSDISGTITVGGAAQLLVGANSARRGFLVQNVSSGPLYVSSTSSTPSASVTAGNGSLRIDAGAYWETPLDQAPTSAFYIFGAVTGQAYVAREW